METNLCKNTPSPRCLPSRPDFPQGEADFECLAGESGYQANTPLQRILFVDDDERIQRGVERLFSINQVPWRSLYASGVDEALDVLQAHAVDAVISDIRMAGRDGFDLLSFLRASPRYRDLPVVMLTGLGDPGLKTRALDLGATDLLSKPINPEELLARIRSILYLKHCQDTIKEQNSRLEILIQQRTEALEATRLDMIWRLGRAAELRSDETGRHVIRVGYFSRLLAEKLGMPAEFCKMLFLTSPLHDLGKIAIPDYILQKDGQLDDEEWRIMQSHCRIGEELLSRDALLAPFPAAGHCVVGNLHRHCQPNPFLEMASCIAGNHHEQWLGRGYPLGRKGEDIPLPARIVTISDVYDALRSPRRYKPSYSHQEALAIMKAEQGIRFDPEIFAAFERYQFEFDTVFRRYGEDLPRCCH
jgi:putative two-component system response regulator